VWTTHVFDECDPNVNSANNRFCIFDIEKKNKNLKDDKESVLEITAFKAFHLSKNKSGEPDPFVTIAAWDDDKVLYKWDQSVVRKGLNPRFDHDFPWKKKKGVEEKIRRDREGQFKAGEKDGENILSRE